MLEYIIHNTLFVFPASSGSRAETVSSALPNSSNGGTTFWGFGQVGLVSNMEVPSMGAAGH